ncbi:hypothetical protein RN70_03955 [Staphylococcus schleiferi]|uniref:putative copper chaperone CsoZ n=1 Tax=Staphylococcus coagulans TaxID=74706 RepID=UPI00067A0528|nr:cation transporter [Staphylococcus coagulans]AKS68739.1 hypothetical protein NP71_03760 [Staphylococcus schleiferi]AKS70961.1 hypothetical protein OA96_03645 [Staphylococcus schleiferi]AKS73134.1 hypothetical protein RN70_03955 [Staphylococcus schleiferi]MBA8765051.1 heavy-metal-associated domain-containing protein [Staphylococcus coagulans]MBT2810777.1 heavy-metal-associated domain-containing protein [Staphylococcus coagulans]
METGHVHVSNLTTLEEKEKLTQRLLDMIGVEAVNIDLDTQRIILTYQTPANLNTLEKEIYDAGFPVIQSHKGVYENE